MARKYRAVLQVSTSSEYSTIDVWHIQKRCYGFWIYTTTKTFSKDDHAAVAKFLAALRKPLIIEETDRDQA